jgi:hypothetical protein
MPVKLLKKFLLPMVLFCFAITACQKEISHLDEDGGGTGNDSSSNTLIGNWNLISVDAKTQSTTEIDFLGVHSKELALFDYVTQNNTGTISFSDTELTATGLSYTISGIIQSYYYEDDVLIDSFQTPQNFTIPATNSTASYQRIGADSIYFPGGSFVNIGDTLLTSAPTGGRLSFNGDALTIIQTFLQDTTIDFLGIPTNITQSGNIIISLQK